MSRKDARWIEAFGARRTLSQWARRAGLSTTTIAARLDRGWPPERAVSEPSHLTLRGGLDDDGNPRPEGAIASGLDVSRLHRLEDET